MTFSESSGMIKIAKINQNLLSSLWSSMADHNFFLKALLLLPVLFYSMVCLFFIVFFYIASVIDIIPYILTRMSNGIMNKTDDLSYKDFGFFSTIFYPLFVFFLGILTVFIIILPKAVGIGEE